MMDCKKATRLMSEQQDRELSPKESAGLKFHKIMCKGCRNFGKQMSTISQLCKSYVKRDDGKSDDGKSEE